MTILYDTTALTYIMVENVYINKVQWNGKHISVVQKKTHFNIFKENV